MEKKDVQDMESPLREASDWLRKNENANKDELGEKLENVKRSCRRIDQI